MSRHIYGWGFIVICGCSGATGAASAPAATARLAGPRSGPEVATVTSAPASPSGSGSRSASSSRLEYHDETEADRRFIENAERAIGEYSAFIARAGDSAEYAPAVKRSREQIEDLQQAIIFVRAGAAQRAAH
ncbi:MAG TPA: hypothetical protein VHM25_18205 [Polyangiaceae bacterium]|jgi:hypothetical protein|nr:hypothetical protein [Polyangiaceae bacterium]